MFRNTLLLFVCSLISIFSFGQNPGKILEEINTMKRQGIQFKDISLFKKIEKSQINQRSTVDFESFILENETYDKFLNDSPISIDLKLEYKNQPLHLSLVQVDILSTRFKVSTSSGIDNFKYNKALFYRGIVDGDDNSVVAISFAKDDVIGIIDIGGDENLVFGSLSEAPRFKEFVLYDINQIEDIPEFGCDLIEGVADYIPETRTDINTRNAINCVNIYFECEYNMFTEEGSVQATVDQMTGIFNVVATLYANDGITINISEIKVWDTPDNYTSNGSTVDALYDFRSKVPNFNGDLAHLVSRGGPSGGGVAFLSGLCNSYSYAYSYIYSSYTQFPTYGWTVNVIAHELGHNLSSNHTHDCAWNGNNTAIDGCGPAAGYSSGCNAPLPQDGGTIMSYCHLIGSVGINWNNGFGPQPTDRITNYINSAACLSACQDCTDEGLTCDDGDNCTTNDVYDANCNCIGIPEPDSDGDGICDAEDLCPGFDDGLIGTSCSDGDICTENDVYTVNCNCEGTYTDSDNDGVCDGNDICPGFNDGIDSDNDGIPDGCDNDCIFTNGSFSVNPLNHSGSGSSPATIVFGKVSQEISFTISGLNAKTNGSPSSRYIERVDIKYTDENNNLQDYGTVSGDQASTYNVLITQRAKSVVINLYDGYDGNANNLTVNLSSVDYCEDDAFCLSPDTDGDGVCDAEDVCPGFDDGIDSDNDGIPDGCDNCSNVSNNFPGSSLSHSGTGSTSMTAALGQELSEVEFTITGLDQRINGKSGRRYIDLVTVTYTDVFNTIQNYGTFSGASVSSVFVNIPSATSVTVSLSDEYDGNTEEATLNVNLSSISGCAGLSASPLGSSPVNNLLEWNIYPNPARDVVTINYQNTESEVEKVTLRFYDLSGKVVKDLQYDLFDGGLNRMINISDLVPSIYFIQLEDGGNIVNKKIIVMNR